MVWSMAGNIVRDYIAYTLKMAGYNNWGTEPYEHPTEAMRTMRLLGQQFESAYNSAFADMTRDIDVDGPAVHEAFMSICSVLFENGIRWGRLVGLIVFSSKLSLKAAQENKHNQIDNIVQWTTEYLQSPRISNWILQHGNWDGFVEFYQRPENQNNHQNGDYSFLRACSLGIATIAGAAGAVAALSFFVGKS